FDQQDGIGRAIEAELVDLKAFLDSIEVDVPDGRFQPVIGLDDREAWARHISLVTERGDESSGEHRLACTKWPGKGDHVARPGHRSQARAERRGRLLILEDHREPRGMVRVTVVPLPFFDSSSTVPPCASMNWRVNGRPSPSAASPRNSISPTRWNRSKTRGKSS